MAYIERWSVDGKYGIRIPCELVESMHTQCVEAGRKETGGVLIGTYNEAHDCAILSEVLGPPSDSKRGRATFFRGVKGLRNLLLTRWRDQRTYYLGEWHFHPGGTPVPSSVDHEQMKAIAKNPSCKCPEAILLIMGQTPEGQPDFGVFVYPDGKNAIDLSTERDNSNANS